MFKHKQKRGFSLIEVMMTILLSLVVMAGLANTLRKVQSSVKNASAGSDLSNSTRALAKLMRNDFANAGRGFGDLLAIQAHYAFNPDFVDIATEDRIMYAVDDLVKDAAGSVAETSGITLHWFDYDIGTSATGTNPTYLVNMPEGDWPIDGVYTNTLELYSMNEEHLESLEPGDVLFFYKHEILTEQDWFIDGDAIWNRDEMEDGGDFEKNSGVILQIGEVSSLSESIDEDLPGMSLVTINFAAEGTFFTNDLSTSINNTQFPGYNFTEDLGVAIRDSEQGYPSLPADVHVARKLGDEKSFHRVQYSVEQETGDDPAVLIRTHNGSREVIATNVTEFSIKIGMDIAPGLPPDAVMRTDMDGYVSIGEMDNWTQSYSDYGTTAELFRTMIGRHAVSAEVSFTQEAFVRDRSDTTMTTGKKTRSFVEQFRIWNNTLPMSSL